ncbi:hypothetical protein CsSME_00013465 [Camellia sinensis var. sinensis]
MSRLIYIQADPTDVPHLLWRQSRVDTRDRFLGPTRVLGVASGHNRQYYIIGPLPPDFVTKRGNVYLEDYIFTTVPNPLEIINIQNVDFNNDLMANNGNGSESSVSGTKSMERIIERAVTSFLQALQTNINNGMPEQREESVTIKQFQDLKPTTFTGGPNPMVANAWVKDMEKIFRALPCTERQKNSGFSLWRKKKLPLGKDSWKYSTKNTSQIHLRNHDNGQIREQVHTTHSVCNILGLDVEIKDRLEVLKLPTYAKVVDQAYIVEKGIKASHSREPSQKKPFWKRDHRRFGVTPPKKVNMGTTSSGNQGPTNSRGGTIPICPICGKAH